MISTKIAHQEILDNLGEGGMRVFYRARDTKLGRDVALNGTPKELFQTQLVSDPAISPHDVSADGQRFLLVQPTGLTRRNSLPVVNWQAGLRQ